MAKNANSKKPVRLKNLDFATSWERAENLSQFIAKTGYSRAGAASRARQLRDAGIDLKEYPRSTPVHEPIDVEGVNAALAAMRD